MRYLYSLKLKSGHDTRIIDSCSWVVEVLLIELLSELASSRYERYLLLLSFWGSFVSRLNITLRKGRHPFSKVSLPPLINGYSRFRSPPSSVSFSGGHGVILQQDQVQTPPSLPHSLAAPPSRRPSCSSKGTRPSARRSPST